MKRIFQFIAKWYALLVVLAAFGWSWAAIMMRRVEEAPADTIVIRIGHWQLEPLVRDGIDLMAEKYAKMMLETKGIKVKITQDAIPESTYAQWFTTQMMGGTAPDIIECALGVPGHVLIGYYNRYFHPLTQHVSHPNPYNAGNMFSNTAWRATFKDGMRSSYVEELQEYMLVPLSQFGVRIFYNKDLLYELTEEKEAPTNWQEFKRVCEIIKSKRIPQLNKPEDKWPFYTPIAASNYHFGMWDWMMADPLGYSLARKIDFSRDGWVDNAELFTAITEGSVNFLMRPYEAKYGLIRELTNFFQPGFTGLGRDEGVFLFIQERAVFMPSGTWDQGSLREQTRGVFNMGIMDFPRPTKDDPDYGDVVEGPTFERPMGGFPFGLTRFSKHPEVALDFLHYLSSMEINEEFNQFIGWIPAVLNTKVTEDLKEFEPNLKGVYGASPFTLGGDTITKMEQVYALFKVGQMEFEPMMKEFGEVYKKRGKEEFMEMVRNDRRGLMGDERTVAALRARMVDAQVGGAEEAVADLEEARYRRMMLGRLMGRGMHYSMLRRIQDGRSHFSAGDPYAMTEEAKKTLREKIKMEIEEVNKTSNDQQGSLNREVKEEM